MSPSITALFVDVGGVLLTNAWDHIARHRAVEYFALDQEALSQRHNLISPLYEEGKLSLDEYLDRVIFYEDRPFSRKDFQAFMFSQSEPWPQMIELVRSLKARYGLKVAAIGNEGWELAAHRIEKFALKTFVDLFIFSCFVRCRKPDLEMYQMALDIAQVPPEAVACIEGQPLFAEAAKSLGLHAFQHLSYKFTRNSLAEWGLSLEG
ncbi:MAG: HAD family hydrolase [Thermoguttaceae bacterium]|jgi:putative hydrolase of the HAD superfamily